MPSPVQLRFLKTIGESTFWKRTGRFHTWLYRLTGGAVGHSAGAIKNLLLTTRGRKSGVERTVPLAYLPDDGRWVVVASNGGADRHPAWWLNLLANPNATVQIGRDTRPVVAHRAEGAEWERLWPLLKANNPFYASYERITARQIPVVVLAPARR
jgi:deazaflavin-dependent oxidoreductase (nitroreductase family)